MEGPTRHAKMAQQIVHAHGLFKSLAPGERRRTKLDVTLTVGDTAVRFIGFEPLDSTDLRVMQALVARTTVGLLDVGKMLSDAITLRPPLKLTGGALSEKVIAARFTLATLAETAGLAKNGGFVYRQLRSSLLRLSNVTVKVSRPPFEGSFHLIAYRIDLDSGQIVVALNPLATGAVLGRSGFLSVNMEEVRRIHSPVAHLLHSRLHWINQGAERKVSLLTLCSYAYGEDLAARSSTQRKRQRAVRNALSELQSVGWNAIETYPGMFLINRPRHRRASTTEVTA
ncbi:replication protein C, IncQ-type [Achromobacter sp. NPDC058515]|uniref:replication protein C, IncQ-type n=1 Tax=Achromobacter sp. NPDC058515 TaxID=3346533 RepID=UPI0036533D8B